RQLCRQDSTRRETGGPSGRAADQIRSRRQPDHRQGTGADDPGIVPAACRRGDRVKRREFITLLGGAAAAWPLASAAQQPAMPVIGFLDSRSSDGMASRLAAFRQGLKEVGLIEGENVTVIYRWAEDRVDRLPEIASELARQATVIVTSGGPTAA